MTRVLLRPRREVEPSGEVVVETELEEGRDAEPPFSDAAWAAFHKAYTAMPECFRLSACLDCLSEHDVLAKQLAVLQISQWFEGRVDDPDVQPAREKFAHEGFYGDDLIVTKRT